MRVKLLTLWVGPLPEWLPQFEERIGANKLVDWDLIHISVAEANVLASSVADCPCIKGSPYSLCDLRPLFGEMFKYRLGYEWWGWVDLDVVLGDLDRLITPLLNLYDIVTTDTWTINGALTFMRNVPEVNQLWRKADYAAILGEPDYCNFDESGFNEKLRMETGLVNGNQHFTHLVRESGLRIHWDNRGWVESSEQIDVEKGIPSRWCEMVDGRLLEIPTGRELLMYHFDKQWPIPDPYPDRNRHRRFAMGKRVPQIDSIQWWEDRLQEVADVPLTELKHPDYNISQEAWDDFQGLTAKVLKDLIRRRSRVLDIGCGFGALWEALELTYRDARYTGLDFSSGVVGLARKKGINCRVHDIYHEPLPFSDRSFDWCVCRGLEGPVLTQIGIVAWKRMLAEMRRVAKRVMVMNLLGEYRVVEGL